MQQNNQTTENASNQQQAAVQSLDDRINAATIDTYQDILPTIAKEQSPVKRELYCAKLAKVIGVTKPAINNEIKNMVSPLTPETDDSGEFGPKYMTARFDGLVDLVLDDNGKIMFLVKNGNGLELMESWADTDGTTFYPPEAKHIKFQLVSASNVMRLINDTNDQQLYNDMLTFFKRFSYLDEDVWPIIIFAVFLSYMQDHQDVRYIPIIYFYAVAQRGKSRTAKTFLSICYRGIHLTDIRSANIVRFSQNLQATLFLDVSKLMKSLEKGDSLDIALGRFEKGSQVVRVMNPDKGPFADQTYFDVYGSTIIATNEPADSILESRCLTVPIANKPDQYENLIPSMGIQLKERVTAWRARQMGRPFPKVKPIPGITGRLWEISEPLIQLATTIAPATVEQMNRVLLEMSGQKTDDLKDTTEGQIVAAITELAKFDGSESAPIPVEEIRQLVNEHKSEGFKLLPQKIGKRLHSLGIKTKPLKGYAQVLISRRELDTLKAQYGLQEQPEPEETLPHPTTRVDAANTTDGALVVSGRELQGVLVKTDEETHQGYLDLVGGAVEVTATETPVADQPKKTSRINWGEIAEKAALEDQDAPTAPDCIAPVIQVKKVPSVRWTRD
ncbi:MAG: hypothetical protein PHY09_06745 [Desulfuromonadaceae bacterium]|nr:hypothetical protein [Desulfuromonadaceae bacterium]MDD5104782.1 hypothetical protein [Desulfuromonadaceae bacterium]